MQLVVVTSKIISRWSYPNLEVLRHQNLVIYAPKYARLILENGLNQNVCGAQQFPTGKHRRFSPWYKHRHLLQKVLRDFLA